MIRTFPGKITSAAFGIGGYQEAMVGLSLTFDAPGWGATSTFEGTWAEPPSPSASWTVTEQREILGNVTLRLAGLLTQARKRSVEELVGVPVELAVDENKLISWRILWEVLNT